MVYVFDGDDYLLVVNAANKDKDFAWINSHKGAFEVSVSDESDLFSQLALQGPLSREVLGRLTDYPLDELKLFGFDHFRIAGKEFMVSRSAIPARTALKSTGPTRTSCALPGACRGAGSIPLRFGMPGHTRFEAAMPLYGAWIGPRSTWPRVLALRQFEKDFIGSEALKKIKAEGPKERIVALELKDRGIAREGYGVPTAKQSADHDGHLLPGRRRRSRLPWSGQNFSEIGTEVAGGSEKLGSGSRAEQEIFKRNIFVRRKHEQSIGKPLYSKSHNGALLKAGLRSGNH